MIHSYYQKYCVTVKWLFISPMSKIRYLYQHSLVSKIENSLSLSEAWSDWMKIWYHCQKSGFTEDSTVLLVLSHCQNIRYHCQKSGLTDRWFVHVIRSFLLLSDGLSSHCQKSDLVAKRFWLTMSNISSHRMMVHSHCQRLVLVSEALLSLSKVWSFR